MNNNRINDAVNSINQMFSHVTKQVNEKEKKEEHSEDTLCIAINGQETIQVLEAIGKAVSDTMDSNFKGPKITATYQTDRKTSIYYKTLEVIAPFSNKSKEQLLADALEVGMTKLAMEMMRGIKEVKENIEGKG